MAQQMVLTDGESGRKSEAIRLMSLGFLFVSIAMELAFFVVWLFEPGMPMMSITILVGAAVIISLLTYWANRSGYVNLAGYFLVIGFLIFLTAVLYLFGGSAGPLAIVLAFPVLLASIAIGIRSTFFVATLVSVILLALLWIETQQLIPQVIAGEWQDIFRGSGDKVTLVYIGAIVRILAYYLVAFLSWFAASRLARALRRVSDAAGELQVAYEKLQTSEEELRTSNEELETANEELRATEEELRSSNEELQTANEELTEAQEKLVRTEKLAAIGQLAGGVGHELRNPLGAIKNAVYYVRGKLEKSELSRTEPRVMEFLEIVDEEINSSNKIISDLLSFSRVGKPATSPARIGKVIEDAIAHTHISEGVELTSKIEDGVPDIEIDTDQIRQVLVNMLTNAVQAMPEGGKLMINTQAKDSFLEVKITDTGQGIPEENIGKIFDPLFTMKAKGIGLGLAVCKSIIDRHGGQISVESAVGKGTTFTVKLPMNK